MKFRTVILDSGIEFQAPQGIQRIDTRSTHGWQVRYQGTKYFSDRSPNGESAKASLERATDELLTRIAKYPAPVTIQSLPSSNKTTNLPSGISGPILRCRSRSLKRIFEFSVVLPLYGKDPHRRTVYISGEESYTAEKYGAALAKAVELRRGAEKQYQEDATMARRGSALFLLNSSKQTY